ncbi:putative Microcephalin [Glarea lozoyensis 74030]|uniref:Putative Microcephalin n=1 Tax=Glarea lozoyensis (strain ATCC 74030 / MF5533) TaxID=1104152 RepID=H0EIL7_GLAL7|nr:putative Microcephalin [Glarea lozoyensis 74030]
MNTQSPPKRVTRARAAAKTDDAGVKTTKIATAASKAKLTRAASTTKRKTRADEAQEEQQQEPDEDELNMKPIIEPEPVRATRGRAKKVVPAEAPAPVAPQTTRGRPKKTIVEAPVAEHTRSLRGRPKKIEVATESSAPEEPPKRATRARATTVTKPPIPKKTVKFEEPDKENIVPAPPNAKGKAKATDVGTGLRAKPVRKPAATVTARATRGRAKSTVEEKTQKPSPLSPKKATQVSTSREPLSEDELATNEKTPMKPLMKSPVKPPGSIFNTAKKLDFTNSISVHRVTTQELGASVIGSPARRPPQSPFKAKESLFGASPQKSNLGNTLGASAIRGSPFKLSLPQAPATPSAFKTSLLQSPARKPQSPTKVAENGSPSRSHTTKISVTATPKVSTLKMTKIATPRTLNRSLMRSVNTTPAVPVIEAVQVSDPLPEEEDILMSEAAEQSMKFSGRLSSIVPREADPSSIIPDENVAESTVDETELASAPEPMAIDEVELVEEEVVIGEDFAANGNTPPGTPSRYSTGTFNLPEGNDSPFADSDSEDELASESFRYTGGPFAGFRSSSHELDSCPATPTPFTAIAKTPRTSKSIVLSEDKASENLGFTPLARQLSDWMAASPVKSDTSSEEPSPVGDRRSSVYAAIQISAEASPVKSTFFDDEMSVREEPDVVAEPEITEMDILEENFTPVELDEEDLDLANEADELSLLEPDEIEAIAVAHEEHAPAHEADESAPSEASQEYGDENKSTPRRAKQSEDVSMQDACFTPTKEDAALWSNLGTPPRTPRRDVNTALLKGAVVYVDVHTTEGADASVLFNELLVQMGARCVKSWNWNGSAEDGAKIGITHVVFKDGGKRTLEKVRETGGVVSCVGVGWVLDCERENKWLDEAPYAVDTSNVPRGGHRRRKSMEPKALANLNGTLVSSSTTPRKSNMSPTKEFLNLETPYTSKSKRRESIQWVRSPSTSSPNDDELANQTLMLSPVPNTPAYEPTTSLYTENGLYGEDTPTGQTPYFLHTQELVQQTAPPAKGRFFEDAQEGGIEEGKGFLSQKKDESVMMRLMAARRKSLQWAPKYSYV